MVYNVFFLIFREENCGVHISGKRGQLHRHCQGEELYRGRLTINQSGQTFLRTLFLGVSKSLLLNSHISRLRVATEHIFPKLYAVNKSYI